jgi:hypothetical protein
MGRRPQYCGTACRVAAHRERIRLAEAQRSLAAELAAARGTAARTWRPLEEDVTEAAGLAAAVLACAAGGNRQDLVLTLAGLRETTGRIERLALTYFDAAARAGQLAAELDAGLS